MLDRDTCRGVAPRKEGTQILFKTEATSLPQHRLVCSYSSLRVLVRKNLQTFCITKRARILYNMR